VLDAIGSGLCSPGEPDRYLGLVGALLHRDSYMVTADFTDYVATQARVDSLFRDPAAWAAVALRNVAGMGRFSVDRTIRDYLDRVWAPPAAR
jgi:starch phosphorylase